MKIPESTKEKRIESIIKHLEEMQPFKDEYSIPSITTLLSKEDYSKYLVPNFIRCGAIPKSELEVGQDYIGDCRNSSIATWNGKVFVYQREKYGTTFSESINHFEDDNGFDLFVPLRKVIK
jgi:hypothetical protein